MSELRTIRIFLSSTFRDFGEERDLLVRQVFPTLRAKLKERFVDLVDVDLRWGITIEEAERGEVLPICLNEIDRARPYFVGMLGERYGWIPPSDVYAADLLKRQPWLNNHQGGKSVTELEILHGVLNNPSMAGRAYFYFRSRSYAKRKAGDYLPASKSDSRRQDNLKNRIRDSGFPVTRYQNPEALARRLERDLWKLLNAEFPASSVPDAHERENRRHAAYAAPRRRLYIGAKQYLQTLDQALLEGKKGVLIEGASGGGKSSLLANWISQRLLLQPNELIFEHYLAASADASDPERLVRRLIEFIRRRIGSQEEIPGDTQQLFDTLPSWLSQASAYAEKKSTRFIIAIDAINGLRRLRDLRWWPQDIPAHVNFIVSCLPGEVQIALKRKGTWFPIVVEPLQPVDCETLLVAYLQRYNKTLPDNLRQGVLAHPLSGNPLFLRTLAEELRLFGVHEELASRLNGYLASTSVQDLFIRVLERIEENFPPAIVQKTMSSVWASRSGLREEEIMGLCDLVQARWAPLRSALDEMLLYAMGQICFAHDFIKEAVQVRYMPHEQAQRDAHLSLANWFAKREPDARRAHEEPYQLQKAEQWSSLRDCLLNAQMFATINKHAGIQELLGYWLLLKKTLGFEFESSYESVWINWKEHSSDVDFLQSAIWMQRFLAYAGCTGNFALDVSHLGLSLSREKNGEAHKETLELMNRMAILLKSRGDYTQAEAMYLHTISLLEKTGRKDESRLAMVMVNLAELTRTRGLLEQAEGLARQALALQGKVKGPWHMSTWLAINNLASILKSRGAYKEAVELHTRALRIVRRRRGFEHKDTSISLNNLGSLFQTLGRKVEAEKAFRSALKIREKLLGHDHIMTITVRNNLALQLKLQGQLDEAETLYRRVLIALEQQLTPGHASLGACANNLGSLLLEKGNLTEAEAYLNQALAIRQSKLGSDHADFATTLNLKARLCQALGLNNEALVLRLQALGILQHKLGPKHREALNTLEQLAKLQEFLRQFQAAEESLQQLIELRLSNTTGTQSKALSRSRELLASFYERNGRAQEALALRVIAEKNNSSDNL